MTSELIKRKRIEGKVAGVLTERELVINIGTSSGVHEGMIFKVLSNEPTEVRDPITNDLLGVIDREKVRVRATEVEEKFAICKTYRVRVIGSDALAGIAGISAIFAPRQEIPETLKAESKDTLPPLPEEESFVKKGDRVVEVLEEGGQITRIG